MRHRSASESLPEFCLNCGEPIRGRFCHACSQENEPAKPSFGALMRDVWGDFLQVDAKLLKTLALLVAKPGFLTNEFLAGRRVRYISPFKLYFWATALFVLIAFRLFYVEDEDLLRLRQVLSVSARENEFVVGPKATPPPIPASKAEKLPEPPAVPTASEDMFSRLFPHRPFEAFGVRIDPATLPDSVAEYAGAQSRLPRERRDNAWAQTIKVKLIHYKKNPTDTLRSLLYGALPNVLIFAVPLWAILMRLFFWRPPRLYIEHLVFALHTHTFAVMAIVVDMALAKYALVRRADQITIFTMAALLGYNFLAARRVYGQGTFKLLVKGGCLTAGYGCILLLAIAVGVAITVITTFFSL